MRAVRNSGEHARLGRSGTRPRVPQPRATLPGTLVEFSCVHVFREGAENCARGGRAPYFSEEILP